MNNVQLPHYRPEQRDSQVPPGGAPEPQTQANNGGPRGFGQPQSQRPHSPAPTMKQGGSGSQAPMPAPGTGQPPNLYPQLTPEMLTQQLYASRNSIPPEQLIMQVYQLLQQRLPQPQEMQQLASLPREQMMNQLFNVPQGPSQIQQAILPQSNGPIY